MAQHDITTEAKILDEETLQALEAECAIARRDGKIYGWSRSGERRAMEAIADAKRTKQANEDAVRGLLPGTWKRVSDQWMVKVDGEAAVGQQVRVTRRDGSSEIHTISRVHGDGIVDVRPAPTTTTGGTTVTIAVAGMVHGVPTWSHQGAERRIISKRSIRIDEDMPSIYGAHLLGREGERGTLLVLDMSQEG